MTDAYQHREPLQKIYTATLAALENLDHIPAQIPCHRTRSGDLARELRHHLAHAELLARLELGRLEDDLAATGSTARRQKAAEAAHWRELDDHP